MAQDLIINGETYEGVERLAAKNTDGGVVVYTEGGGGGGVVPTISVKTITGGHRVTITDITGTKTFDVMNGEAGPAGKDGASGAAGEDGVSPIVSVTTIAGGHRVTITDINGTKYFDVMNGKDGSGEGGGADGEDGVTFYPSVDAAGTLSWTNDGGLANPEPVNIMGPQGPAGKDGETLPQYMLVGKITGSRNATITVELYKDGVPCTETLYLHGQVASGNSAWRTHGTSTGNFTGSKSWSFGGDASGIGWKMDVYRDSTQTELLASCAITGGATGVTFTPSVDSSGNLSWTNDGGLTNPAEVNIAGPQGIRGEPGPAGADGAPGAAGKDATINGVSTLTITGNNGVAASQSGSTLTLSVSGTFGGQAVANSGGQTPGTSLLRNSKLVSADTNPSNNGEINWTYG